MRRKPTDGRYFLATVLLTALLSNRPASGADAPMHSEGMRASRTFMLRSSEGGSGPRKFLFLGDRALEGRVQIRLEGDEVFANDQRAYPLPPLAQAPDEQMEKRLDDSAMRIRLVRNDVRKGMSKRAARARFDRRLQRQLEAIRIAAKPNASKAVLERRVRAALDPSLVETSRRSKMAPQLYPTEDVLIRIFIKDLGWLITPALDAHESESNRRRPDSSADARSTYSLLEESLADPGNSVLIMDPTGTLAYRNNRQADDILAQVAMIRAHHKTLSKAELATFTVTLPQRIQRLICVQSGGCAE